MNAIAEGRTAAGVSHCWQPNLITQRRAAGLRVAKTLRGSAAASQPKKFNTEEEGRGGMQPRTPEPATSLQAPKRQ